MRSKSAIMQSLATGSIADRASRGALLALALQVRAAWLLLGPWVVWGGASSLPRLRVLPAHPDWYLPAVAQSCVAAAVLVALARRFRIGSAIALAALASAVGWALTAASLPSGLDPYGLALGLPRELLATAFLLVCMAFVWARLRRWIAVPTLALVGGIGAGSIRFLVANTLLGAPWPDGWTEELALEVLGVALLAAVLELTRRATAETRPAARALVATAGVLLLALVHLAAGTWISGWTRADSLWLSVATAVLALVVIALLLVRPPSSPAPDAERAAARTGRG